MFGTKVIQDLIEHLNNEQIEKLCVECLPNGKAIRLINHVNGYHVLLKLLDKQCSKFNLPGHIQLSTVENQVSNEKIEKAYKTDSNKQKFEIKNSNIKNNLKNNYKDKSSLKGLSYEETAEIVNSEFNKKITLRHKENLMHPDYIFDLVLKNLELICYDEHGCCFIQRCLDFLANTEFGKHLIFRLLSFVEEFTQDQFANYIIQYIIKMKIDLYNDYILYVLMPNLYYFAVQKHASKVVVNLINNHTSKIEDLSKALLASNENIKALLFNNYGNYGK